MLECSEEIYTLQAMSHLIQLEVLLPGQATQNWGHMKTEEDWFGWRSPSGFI